MEKTINFIQDKIKINPQVGLILGSGLGDLAEEVREAVTIPYAEIPGFPVSTVQGHKGQLVIGNLQGVPVFTLQGRFHYYEGYSMDKITFPVRVMQGLGISTLIVTNAAGGINLNFTSGALMLIKDHINLMGDNPLRGKNWEELGPRFPDMTNAYSPRLLKLAQEVAADLKIKVESGVYVALPGQVMRHLRK